MDEALMDEVNDTSEETIITEEGSRWDKLIGRRRLARTRSTQWNE